MSKKYVVVDEKYYKTLNELKTRMSDNDLEKKLYTDIDKKYALLLHKKMTKIAHSRLPSDIKNIFLTNLNSQFQKVYKNSLPIILKGGNPQQNLSSVKIEDPKIKPEKNEKEEKSDAGDINNSMSDTSSPVSDDDDDPFSNSSMSDQELEDDDSRPSLTKDELSETVVFVHKSYKRNAMILINEFVASGMRFDVGKRGVSFKNKVFKNARTSHVIAGLLNKRSSHTYKLTDDDKELINLLRKEEFVISQIGGGGVPNKFSKINKFRSFKNEIKTPKKTFYQAKNKGKTQFIKKWLQ